MNRIDSALEHLRSRGGWYGKQALLLSLNYLNLRARIYSLAGAGPADVKACTWAGSEHAEKAAK
jgi:hypothetical protein